MRRLVVLALCTLPLTPSVAYFQTPSLPTETPNPLSASANSRSESSIDSPEVKVCEKDSKASARAQMSYLPRAGNYRRARLGTLRGPTYSARGRISLLLA